MDLKELFFISLGTIVAVYYGVKLLLVSRMLFPKFWFPLSKSFFTSMGEWAVVTGASEGIGRAYAFSLAQRGMNVVILSRTKVKLDQVAKEINDTTGKNVKVIVADFIREDAFSGIEDQLKDLNIGVLVNNVGILPSTIPCNFLETEELDQIITKVVNCNVKTVVKMCKIILPGMEKRGKGIIVNVSSGAGSFPFPQYSLYAASKVFVERFSQGLQTEYKDKGIIIQTVAPFAVSTRMTAFQEINLVTLSAEDLVRSSLQYLRAGDKTYGSIIHTLMGWLLQTIPSNILHSNAMQRCLRDYVKNNIAIQNAALEKRSKALENKKVP